jgi:hypothetical protein
VNKIFSRAPNASHRGYINNIGMLRVNGNAVDGFCIFKPHIFPCFATIQAFVNALSAIVTVARISFTGSGPYNGCIVLLYGNRTNTTHIHFVENRLPGNTTSAAFPKSTAGSSHVHQVWIFVQYRNGSNPSTHTRRANGAGFQVLEQSNICGLCPKHGSCATQHKKKATHICQK